MNDDRALLDEVVAHPDDDVLRHVYADWLEEHGDPRAEFFRLEFALAGLAEDDPDYAEKFARLRELWSTLDRD
jgi:uncharacterized protein (TIGR02996 family)